MSMAIQSIWKIVLIDDEEDIREIMTVALQDAGYTVESASDGATGLKLCETICPQIVITDIRMPGKDGLQVLETIKRKYPDIEVIIVVTFNRSMEMMLGYAKAEALQTKTFGQFFASGEHERFQQELSNKNYGI